jgi:hypothetical protein
VNSRTIYDPVLEVLSRLDNVKGGHGKWQACCPAHEDRTPSLSISVGEDGQVLLYCHAGCKPENVVAAMGLEMRDLWPDRDQSARVMPGTTSYKANEKAGSGAKSNNHNGKTSHGAIIKRTPYRYIGEDDNIYIKERTDFEDGDKDFAWFSEEGYKAHRKGLNGYPLANMLLHHHLDVEGSPLDEPVIFAEGEKATDALAERGFLAVCAAGGASQKDFGRSLEALRGRVVYLWPDHDDQGRAFMNHVADALKDVAAEIRELYLWHSDIQDHDDAFEYLARFGADNVSAAMQNAPVWSDLSAGTAGASAESSPQRQTQFRAPELLTLVLPEPKWAIPNLLPEGLSILGGKPKMGKSWLALGMCVAIATGGAVLGSIRVEPGEVLYLALEDNPRRLQDRLKKVLGGERQLQAATAALGNLTLDTQWPRLDKNGLTFLRFWLDAHPGARLVVIDTWARIKPRQRTSGSQYDEDYASVEGLQQLASEAGVAILIVTHLRKMDADDPLDTLNATLGFSGGADSILILKRERGRHDASLFVSGRDVEEQDIALKWDADIFSWSAIGEAEEYRQSLARKEIIDVLRNASAPMAPKDVATLLGKPAGTVRKLMWEMSRDGELTPEGGKYSINTNR